VGVGSAEEHMVNNPGKHTTRPRGWVVSGAVMAVVYVAIFLMLVCHSRFVWFDSPPVWFVALVGFVYHTLRLATFVAEIPLIGYLFYPILIVSTGFVVGAFPFWVWNGIAVITRKEAQRTSVDDSSTHGARISKPPEK
jgi:hypothetical protein